MSKVKVPRSPQKEFQTQPKPLKYHILSGFLFFTPINKCKISNPEVNKSVNRFKSYFFANRIPEINAYCYYGNDCNVMTEIPLSRYDLFISRRMITYTTTNLNGDEIEEIYGIRIKSRLRELFNLISYPFIAEDKRTLTIIYYCF